MRGIVGRIEIDGNAPSMSAKTLAVTFDHATGQFHAHAIKSVRTSRVLETRQRGLRGQIATRQRIAAYEQLVDRIRFQSRRIVGIRVAAGQAMNTLPQQLHQAVLDLARLTPVRQTSSHRLDQAITPIGSLQQHRAAIAGTLPLVKGQHQRPLVQIAEQQTLCRGRIRQAKASLDAINTVLTTCL